MDAVKIEQLLRHANQLKRTARTGWVQRGVPQAENVAAHSYGVVFITMMLAELVDAPIDVEKALRLAILHDLPESLTTDIPVPAWRYLPDGVKPEVERGAMQEMMADLPFADSWMALWEEMNARETAESRLVHDADKLDMYLQARIYQEQTSNQHLDQFWQRPHTFHTKAAQALYDRLQAQRSE